MSTLIIASLLGLLAPQTAPQKTAIRVGFIFGDQPEDKAFGHALALQDAELFVGSPGSDLVATGAGSVQRVLREPGGWEKQERLAAWDADGGESFGEALALDGNVLAVGAPGESVGGLLSGAVYVFARDGSTWLQDQKLTATSLSGAPTLGRALALSGDTLAAVGQSDNGIDAVFVFERQAGAFVQTATIEPHAGVPGGWSFVSSVDLVGDLLAAGAPSDFDPGFSSTGSASVYRRGAGSSWLLEERAWGSADDWFGYAVSLDRTALPGSARLAVGALFAGAQQSGEVHLLEEASGTWSAGPVLTNPVFGGSDEFGCAVALEGPVLIVGERGEDGTTSPDLGQVHVFQDSGAGLVATDAFKGVKLGGELGATVVLDGEDFLAGVPGTLAGPGDVWPYELRGAALGTSYCTAGTSQFGCQVLISATGNPSATAPSGFLLHADPGDGDRDGIFYFGTSGRLASPWGNSSNWMCVAPPRVRLPRIEGAGTNGTCNGSPRLDVNAVWCPACPSPQKNPGIGAVVQFQYWYRDPQNTSNMTTSLSDAVEVTVGP